VIVGTVALVTLMAAAPRPAAKPALSLRLSPSTARLGDTVSVVVSTRPGLAPPVVTVGGHEYPAFEIAANRHRALIPISPLDKPGRWRVTALAGKERASASLPVARRRFGLQRIWLPPGVRTELDPIERARVGTVKALATPEKRWSAAFVAPARGRVSSPFGVRRYRNGVFLTDYYHRGIDYAPGAGKPVSSPAGGRVVLVGLQVEGFRVHGNTVAVDHGHGVVSLFLHLLRATVREGDDVGAGDSIGLVGGTGAATAPHLHWGLYVSGVAVDPGPWMRDAVD
jgi:murein DD-endopeptidase MepM/ murein hydrolase activator NlpD